MMELDLKKHTAEVLLTLGDSQNSIKMTRKNKFGMWIWWLRVWTLSNCFYSHPALPPSVFPTLDKIDIQPLLNGANKKNRDK